MEETNSAGLIDLFYGNKIPLKFFLKGKLEGEALGRMRRINNHYSLVYEHSGIIFEKMLFTLGDLSSENGSIRVDSPMATGNTSICFSSEKRYHDLKNFLDAGEQ